MKFTITQEDIKKAIRRSPWSCPVALCIRRTVGDKMSVRIERPHFVVVGGRHYPASPELQLFMDAFDNGRNPKPISFELPVEVQP